MAKLPSFQFYPGDWLKDPDLRICSLAAKGLLIDMLCYMHESQERGVLLVRGKPLSDVHIARLFGGGDTREALAELIDNGVIVRREDGALYSKRMVRDEHIRQERTKAGAQGGKASIHGPGFAYAIARANDGAIKIGCSCNPKARMSQIASRNKVQCELLYTWDVTDMEAAEKTLHGMFMQQRIDGEWFSLSADDLSKADKAIFASGFARAKQAANSSSSSSSSSSDKDPPYPPHGKKKEATSEEPQNLDGVDPQAWDDFCKHRQSTASLRKGWSTIGKTKAANALRTMTPQQQRRCVDYSIVWGYPGLYPEKANAANQRPDGQDRKSAADRNAEFDDYIARELERELGGTG